MIRCRPSVRLCPPPLLECGYPTSPPPAPFIQPLLSGDLAVITCHFNWQSYERPRQHLHRFLRQMQAQALPVFGVEAVLPGQAPQTENLPGWCQITAAPERQLLFQKEALLNVAETLVPRSIRKLVFLDADVWIDNADWARQTSLLLNHFPMVQPFAKAQWTSREGKIIREGESIAIAAQILTRGAHPGFAMACRRELWRECGGLYPWMILGGGDMAIAAPALHLDPIAKHVGRGTEVLLEKDAALFRPWEARMRQWTGGRMAWTPGNCIHEWHGDRQHRAYERRHEMLADLDTAQHLRIAANGLVEWTESAPPHLIEAVRDYFASRKEDG